MSESFVTSGGAKIWTVRTGEGFPVILCNGGPGCSDYLEPVAAMLDDTAQVIRFEERGCGRSELVPPFDIATTLQDLENVREFYNVDRLIIGGHSWGSDLALFYALKYASRVAGLICIAGGRIHNDREWHNAYKRNERERGEKVPEFARPPNMEVNEQVNRSWKHYIQNPALLRNISKLETPALFIYGEKDIRPAWATEQLANLMPNARFQSIEGAEHVIWLSHENELRLLLRQFIADISLKEMQ